jgi:uncharacterized protein YifE (UPF0438 family)
LQLTLDLTIPEDHVAKPSDYRHPLENFRDLAIASGMILKNDDMGILRAACLGSGLSQAGWRFLNRYAEDAYAAVIATVEDKAESVQMALFYINWQCRGGLKEPLADELGKRLITSLGDINDPAFKIDPRIAQLANDYWNQLADPADRESFARQEWVHVLNWIRDEQPGFDRNQWRSGWLAIHRNYQKWRMLNPARNAWHSLLPGFEQDGLRIRPLTSSYELAHEGYRMGNCVASYARGCLAGHFRLFSISEITSGRPLATAGIRKIDSYWKIDQIKGRFNREPQARVAGLGRVILKKYSYQEELISRRKSQEHKRYVEQLRAEHELHRRKRLSMPVALRAEFSREEITFLEKHASWLGGLASGELLPIDFEQARFVAVTKGIFPPETESERIWLRLRVFCGKNANGAEYI